MSHTTIYDRNRTCHEGQYVIETHVSQDFELLRQNMSHWTICDKRNVTCEKNVTGKLHVTQNNMCHKTKVIQDYK